MLLYIMFVGDYSLSLPSAEMTLKPSADAPTQPWPTFIKQFVDIWFAIFFFPTDVLPDFRRLPGHMPSQPPPHRTTRLRWRGADWGWTLDPARRSSGTPWSRWSDRDRMNSTAPTTLATKKKRFIWKLVIHTWNLTS